MPARVARVGSAYAIDRQAVQTGGPYDDYLVYDTFTDDDGVALAAHEPEKDVEGGGWVEESGAWDINTNQVAETTGVAGANAVIDSGQSNVLVTCNIKFPPNGGINSLNGIIVRYLDEDNYIMLYLQGSTGSVILFKNVATVWTQIGSWAGGLTNGTVYAISISVNSSNEYSVRVDGTERITKTDATHATETIIGLRAYNLLDEATFDLFTAILN